MPYRMAADAVLFVHLAFTVFVVVGGFLAWRWPRLAWIHIPAAVWGVFIEFAGWVCPLTPLENHFRRLAGEAGYDGGFIEHYLVLVLYPRGLTPTIQVALGTVVILVNGYAYSVYFRRRRQRTDTSDSRQ